MRQIYHDEFILPFIARYLGMASFGIINAVIRKHIYYESENGRL